MKNVLALGLVSLVLVGCGAKEEVAPEAPAVEAAPAAEAAPEAPAVEAAPAADAAPEGVDGGKAVVP